MENHSYIAGNNHIFTKNLNVKNIIICHKMCTMFAMCMKYRTFVE